MPDPLTKSVGRRRSLVAALVGAALIGAWPHPAPAQSWPVKPVQIIHGFNAGANPDLISRALQPALSERLGQSVIVDSRPGASGRIATSFVAKQPADGYTFIMITGGDGVLAATVRDLPYDLLRDFAFVSLTTVFPFLIVVPADSPYRTLGELLDDARKRPGKLGYGHSGVASTLHLVGELIKDMANVDIVHIPYKGTQAQELAAGRAGLDFAVSVSAPAMPLIKAGRLRVLAVTSVARDPGFPDVPTVGETLAGYEVTSWLGVAAPVGTSPAIVDRLSLEIRTVLARDDVKARLAMMSTQGTGSTGAEFRARVAADIAKWRRLAEKVKLD
ncbi:MAG: tripartite tricarboxylate transporter substrate binding protein [Betaproteobacteria bacterium]|nr:tripartite tricarboxylate transporter substrate binding protein [Betaproteobacteria bacterium]